MEYRKQQFQTYDEFARQFPCDYSMPFARGGHGELYRGIDTETNDEVAIKRRLYTVGDDALSLEKEYTNTQEVPPNRFIVRYLYYGRYATPFGTYEYLVMRYYRDGNLTNNVLPWHQLSDTLQRRFVEEFLLGLNHLHKHKIVHRDIKPENVLLVRYAEQQTSAYRPILADFGISKVLAENPEIARTLVQNSMRVGTVTYMAPEQLRGERVTYNSDLWSFGIILYEIITRKHMIARRSFSEQQREEAYGFWRNVDEQRFPDDLSMVAQPYQELIRRCLVVNPKLRAQRATDLIDLMNQPLTEPAPVNTEPVRSEPISADANPEKQVVDIPLMDSTAGPAHDTPAASEQSGNLGIGQNESQPASGQMEVVPLSQLTMQLTELLDESMGKPEEPASYVDGKFPGSPVKTGDLVDLSKTELSADKASDSSSEPVPSEPVPVRSARLGLFRRKKSVPTAEQPETAAKPIVEPTPAEVASVASTPVAEELVSVVPAESKPIDEPVAGSVLAEREPIDLLQPDAVPAASVAVDPVVSAEPVSNEVESDTRRPANLIEVAPILPKRDDKKPDGPKAVPPKRLPADHSPAKLRTAKRHRATKPLADRSPSLVGRTLASMKARWQMRQMPGNVEALSQTTPKYRWSTRLVLTGLVLISLTVGVYSSGSGVEEVTSSGPTLQQSESYIVALQRFNRHREFYQKTGALNEYLWTFIHCNPTYEDSLVESGVQRANIMLSANQALFPAYQGNPAGLKRQEMKRLVLNKISWESRPHDTDELSCQPRN